MSSQTRDSQAICSIRCSRMNGIAMPKIRSQLLTEPTKRIKINFLTYFLQNIMQNVLDRILRSSKVEFSMQPKYEKATGHQSNPIAVPD